MAGRLGIEDSENPCKTQVWEVARTQIGTHAYDALRREVTEVVKKWPILSRDLRAGILAIVRASGLGEGS